MMDFLVDESVISWLLDSDPSIRWQVMRDVIGASERDVALERARVGVEGFGSQVLGLQDEDGQWGGAAWNRGWNSTMHALMLLRELGLDPSGTEARAAIDLVRESVKWRGDPAFDGRPFFDGEVEPCINAQVAVAGAYFAQDVHGIIDRLLGEQLPDGGWNCDTVRGSTRSSFNTTICVLEALNEFDRTRGSNDTRDARLRGEEYLLDRRLLRRRSTGKLIERDRKSGARWTDFAHPVWWHYDVLRALDYFRSTGRTPDQRLDDAFALVETKRDQSGRWPLDTAYAGTMLIHIDDEEGRPSKWNTLRALRVLRWRDTIRSDR